MQCSCDIDIDIDIEHTKIRFYNKNMVIAIIDHKCNECKRIIPQDEEYELVYGCWDNCVSTVHTCIDCLNLRNIFFPHGYYYNQLWEEVEENLNSWNYQIPEECMIKLSKRNFNKMCELIEDGWIFLDSMEKGGLSGLI